MYPFGLIVLPHAGEDTGRSKETLSRLPLAPAQAPVQACTRVPLLASSGAVRVPLVMPACVNPATVYEVVLSIVRHKQ